VTERRASIETGDVVPAYPYLWLWQSRRGEQEGRKSRPVCVAIASRGADGLTHLALLAITGSPPRTDQIAVELPPLEIRRIGLSEFKQAWVIVSEYNYDILERSFSLEPSALPRTRLSRSFLKAVLTAFRPTLAGAQTRVDRL
jgi:hypothetical protein